MMAALLQGNYDQIFCYLGLTGLMKYTIYYLWKDRKPANAKVVGHVKELKLHPLKSARGITHSEVHCASGKGAYNGYTLDRHFMVIASDRSFVTGRQDPLLNKIQPKVEGSKMILSALGQKDVEFDINAVEKSGKLESISVYGISSTLDGLDCGDDVASWLDGVLSQKGCRLLYSGPDVNKRRVSEDVKRYPWTKHAKDDDRLAFHDTISFHLCTEESLADLNSRLKKPVTINHFRPNILVSTGAEAFFEDTWKDFFIGAVRFKTIKLCDRCVMPTIDPDLCERDKDGEPQKTLKSYRSLVSGLGPFFGIDLVVEKPGVIKVGDPIYLVSATDNTQPE